MADVPITGLAIDLDETQPAPALANSHPHIVGPVASRPQNEIVHVGATESSLIQAGRAFEIMHTDLGHGGSETMPGYLLIALVEKYIEEQLRSYCLSDRCAKQVEVFIKLDAASLDRIDIVAGTMTTLVYELLPCGKIVWYLDTAFRHLEDLVDEGLAHRISLDEIRPPGQMDPAKLKPSSVDCAHLFGETPLQEVIRSIVVPAMSA